MQEEISSCLYSMTVLQPFDPAWLYSFAIYYTIDKACLALLTSPCISFMPLLLGSVGTWTIDGLKIFIFWKYVIGHNKLTIQYRISRNTKKCQVPLASIREISQPTGSLINDREFINSVRLQKNAKWIDWLLLLFFDECVVGDSFRN